MTPKIQHYGQSINVTIGKSGFVHTGKGDVLKFHVGADGIPVARTATPTEKKKVIDAIVNNKRPNSIKPAGKKRKTITSKTYPPSTATYRKQIAALLNSPPSKALPLSKAEQEFNRREMVNYNRLEKAIAKKVTRKNPVSNLSYFVEVKKGRFGQFGERWLVVGAFASKSEAEKYAREFHSRHPADTHRVILNENP